MGVEIGLFLHGCGNWFVNLRDERRAWLCQNRI